MGCNSTKEKQEAKEQIYDSLLIRKIIKNFANNEQEIIVNLKENNLGEYHTSDIQNVNFID